MKVYEGDGRRWKRKARDRDISVCVETMGSKVVEEGATGTMAGRRKPALPDGRRRRRGAACAKTPRVEKTKEGRVYDSLPAINVPEGRVSRDGNTRENVNTRVSSRGPTLDRVA